MVIFWHFELRLIFSFEQLSFDYEKTSLTSLKCSHYLKCKLSKSSKNAQKTLQ